MAIYLKWATTLPDTVERFVANLFSNLSRRWYPSNIIGSPLYDLLEMYGTEFASSSVELTKVADDLYLESVRTGMIAGHANSKMYENFGTFVGTNKIAYQEFSQFNTGSILNSYRTMLKFLTLSHIEGGTADALARIGQAVNGVSPVIIEPIINYPGWVLTNYSGSVLSTFSNGQNYAVVSPPFGRFGSTIPIGTLSIATGSSIELSYSILGVNTILQSEAFYRGGVLLYFFVASGSVAQTTAVQAVISNAVNRVLPAYIEPRIFYSVDFVTWRPVAPPADTMVVSSSVFATSPLGWIYNATPTPVSGSMYVTDVLTIP